MAFSKQPKAMLLPQQLLHKSNFSIESTKPEFITSFHVNTK
jgi:hypothetical protein